MTDILDTALDSFEKSVGLPAFGFAEQEAMSLLLLTKGELRSMSSEECGEGAFLLNAFSFHLQRAFNREQGKMMWADESVKKKVSHLLSRQRGASFEERRLTAISEYGEDAEKLEKVRVNAKIRAERLSFLSSKVDNMSRSLISLQQAKRGRNG